jgi:RimJ/RimL family protein N-acetyltransferase
LKISIHWPNTRTTERYGKNLRDEFPHPYTVGDAEKFIAHVVTLKPKTIFAIATEDEAIGSMGIIPGVDVHRFTAEMGYWLGEPFWGRGIMTQLGRRESF